MNMEQEKLLPNNTPAINMCNNNSSTLITSAILPKIVARNSLVATSSSGGSSSCSNISVVPPDASDSIVTTRTPTNHLHPDTSSFYLDEFSLEPLQPTPTVAVSNCVSGETLTLTSLNLDQLHQSLPMASIESCNSSGGIDDTPLMREDAVSYAIRAATCTLAPLNNIQSEENSTTRSILLPTTSNLSDFLHPPPHSQLNAHHQNEELNFNIQSLPYLQPLSSSTFDTGDISKIPEENTSSVKHTMAATTSTFANLQPIPLQSFTHNQAARHDITDSPAKLNECAPSYIKTGGGGRADSSTEVFLTTGSNNGITNASVSANPPGLCSTTTGISSAASLKTINIPCPSSDDHSNEITYVDLISTIPEVNLPTTLISHVCMDCGNSVEAIGNNAAECPTHTNANTIRALANLSYIGRPNPTATTTFLGINNNSNERNALQYNEVKESSGTNVTPFQLGRDIAATDITEMGNHSLASSQIGQNSALLQPAPTVFHVINDTLITCASQPPLKRPIVPVSNTATASNSALLNNISFLRSTKHQEPNKEPLSRYQEQALDLRGQSQDPISLSSTNTNSTSNVRNLNSNIETQLRINMNVGSSSSPQVIEYIDQTDSTSWMDRVELNSIPIMGNSLTDLATVPLASSSSEMDTQQMQYSSKHAPTNYQQQPHCILVSENHPRQDNHIRDYSLDNLGIKNIGDTPDRKSNLVHPHLNNNNDTGVYHQNLSDNNSYNKTVHEQGHISYATMQGKPNSVSPMDSEKEKENNGSQKLREEDNFNDQYNENNNDNDSSGDEEDNIDGQLSMSDENLLRLSVRDLNKMLHGLPKNKQQVLKQKRRTLKNRGYAQNCRSKRTVARQDLEVTNNTLHKSMQDLVTELSNTKKERDLLKELLYKEKMDKKRLEELVISSRGSS